MGLQLIPDAIDVFYDDTIALPLTASDNVQEICDWLKSNIGGDSPSVVQLASPVLLNATDPDWIVNGNAAVMSDQNNGALSIRSFDDSLIRGAGFLMKPPTGLSTVQMHVVGRARTAPATPKAVVWNVYSRRVPINAAIPAWVGPNSNTLAIPANAFFQLYTLTFSYAALGLIGGQDTLWEVVRNGAHASDTLVGNFNLLSIVMVFLP